ncbi:MAG: hypothetical protein UR88_C0003G0010 [Candidatus Nomurabacteria bacterium GW2011_GWA1_35_8]|uniref:Uncharacterized protein n=2 Tax=Candidatus Nomuraibacteriota TaxID=1752729 RepID=A0A0G0G2H1_9BACT|nr:MAG: hypothetical protein UR88_C0003G0010 [Candidatus Nomurabacteria bacterium GW2011_GWA1_35_8]
MDNMLGENKNLKDTSKDSIKDPERKSLTSYGAGTSNMSAVWAYNKINKLITALYMVTDTMDKEEPIRLKLRTLGVEILSDTSTISRTPFDIEKINQILSFLNITFDVGMISEMNCNIIRKEFIELKQSIQEFTAQNHLWLEEFVKHSSEEENSSIGHSKFNDSQKNMSLNKGQRTRIGVQKGNTLMKALSEAEGGNNFETLKNKRREEIITIIKNKKEVSNMDGVTITDIKKEAKGLLASCGEKTLQRELISMVKDNILKKTGEKRWSQYFINQ